MTNNDTLTGISAEHITSAAQWAAMSLRKHGIAHVELTPGDATRYEVIVTLSESMWGKGSEVPNRMGMIVSIPNFGTSYYWPVLGYTSASYATEKWGKGNFHTGSVIAMFLNDLAPLLPIDLVRSR